MSPTCRNRRDWSRWCSERLSTFHCAHPKLLHTHPHTHTRCLQEVRGWHAEQTSAAPSTLHKVTMVGPMEAAVTWPDLDWRVCLGKLDCTQDRQVRKIFHFSYFAERLSALVECQLVP